VRGTSIGCGPCVQSELIAGLPADNEGIEGSQLNDYGIRLPCRGTGVKDSVATVSWLTPAPVCPPDTHPPGPGSSRSGQGKKRISFWMAGMSGVQACPGGKYQTSTGKSYCENCAEGKANPGTGAFAESSCIQRSAGTYSLPGSEACTACSEGKFQDSPGESSCKDYPVGQGIGADSCLICDAGKYSPSSSRSSSLGCAPAGKPRTSDSRSSGCSDCQEHTLHMLPYPCTAFFAIRVSRH
jgi:hypothetical protein